MNLDWPSIREPKGTCPECASAREGGGESCVNRQFPFGCDGWTADLDMGDEIPCRESTTKAQCFATGFCGGCGIALCDEHGSDDGFHLFRCKHGEET
jgi:hypothetical protein